MKLGPNILHDQKDIWLFPVSVAQGHHLKPVLILTGITVGLVAGVDNPSGRYFQHTQAFSGFNTVFSGLNTSIAMFAVPSAVYGIGLLRKDSYAQHTFMLAGEAVIDSEILTTVMKDIDRRLKPVEVPPNGNFADTWFQANQGSLVRGIGSFPSGHTIESRSQTGHRRRMASAQLAAQSVSSLCGGRESGIKRIVAHGSSAPALTCQDLSRKRSSSP